MPAGEPRDGRVARLAEPGQWPPRPLLMGVVNATPDSFSDGGRHPRWEDTVAHALRLADAGADLLDIGAESTRPGADPVEPDEEWARLEPVLRALRGETDLPLSIDSRRPEVVARALELGADWINDIGGLRDPAMAPLAARTGVGLCIMHMLGEPATMQQAPHYDDVVGEVCGFLRERAQRAEAAGVPPGRIWLDPGIGFGKRPEHNLLLLRDLDRLAALGYPVLVGASRKRFIGAIAGDPVGERLAGSLAAVDAARALPRAIVRVHDVRATRQYLMVRDAIARGEARAWESS